LPNDSQERFIERALRRKNVFLALSMIGVAIAIALTAYYGFRRLEDPTFPIGTRAVIVVLILLNSRQNLRQYRFASFVEEYRKRDG
jgi:formate-dependent nitrite reductase membrane component NrfD